MCIKSAFGFRVMVLGFGKGFGAQGARFIRKGFGAKLATAGKPPMRIDWDFRFWVLGLGFKV